MRRNVRGTESSSLNVFVLYSLNVSRGEDDAENALSIRLLISSRRSLEGAASRLGPALATVVVKA